MNVSSQERVMSRRWPHRLYLGFVSLILIGIVIEGLLIGPSLFAATRWGRAVHGDLGAVLFLLTLLLPVVARMAHLPGRVALLSVALFVLALLEVTSAPLGRMIPLMAAVHPANALLMAGLAVVLLTQAWPLMPETRAETRPSR